MRSKPVPKPQINPINQPNSNQPNPTGYPSNWQLGKPRGSLKEQPTGYMVTLSPPGEKQINSYFTKTMYGTKEKALIAAERYMQAESDKRDLTRNQIRYLDVNTVEVKLTQDKTMKTNAKFLDKVQKYPLNVKTKKTKTGERYYAMCQDKKHAFPFTDLICTHKIVEYINGDSLDLREENIKGFGEVIIKDTIKANIATNQYEYFKTDPTFLPKNMWLLGKPTGTVFKRTGENIYSVRVNDENDHPHTRTFNVENYKSDEEAYEEAYKWQIETSYKLGMTKNLIKVLDNDVIEVQLTKNQITKTNKIFIPLIQKIPLFVSTSGNGMVYCACVINNVNKQFHTLITGFSLVDHKNGDTLNNTLDNLRFVDYAMNNANRHKNEGVNIDGVKENDYGTFYVAKIIICGKTFMKYYNCDQYTLKEAAKLATDFKTSLTQTDISTDLTLTPNKKILLTQLVKVEKALWKMQSTINYDINTYPPTKLLDEKTSKQVFNYYLTKQIKYHQEIIDKKTKILAYMEENEHLIK